MSQTASVDLNRLRSMVLDNQAENANLPTRQGDKVLVDREGAIRLGAQASPEEARQLSEVHQGTFASVARLERDRVLVARKFPRNTRYLAMDNVPGFLYTLTSEVGDRYDLFTYHDGSLYQVLVVFPHIAGRYSPHDGHLFSDGRICFGPEGGLPDLEHAYAKSALWATGFSIFTRTGRFPFSKNN